MTVHVDRIPERPGYQIMVDGHKRYWFNGKPFRIAYRLDQNGKIDPKTLVIISEDDKIAYQYYGLTFKPEAKADE